jgi:hypothetical protein
MMIVGLIVACEVGFWVLLLAGLTARYALHWPRVGAALLVSVPLVDVVLLVATIVDLRGGAVATAAHGLAGAYIGFSVAFGHGLVKAADVRVAHRFGVGPAPVSLPRRGPAWVRREWHLWGRAVLAWAVACGVLLLAVAAVGNASRTRELIDWVEGLTVAMILWLLAGPLLAAARTRLLPG